MNKMVDNESEVNAETVCKGYTNTDALIKMQICEME